MCEKRICTDKSHLEPDMLIIHPKNITQYPNININPRDAGSRNRHQERGWGDKSCSSQPWDGAGCGRGRSQIPFRALPARRRYWLCQGGTGRAGHGELCRDPGSWIMQEGERGLMQGKDAARQLFGSASIPQSFFLAQNPMAKIFPSRARQNRDVFSLLFLKRPSLSAPAAT